MMKVFYASRDKGGFNIRDLLGHESIKTTEVHARADNTLKRKAIDKADPIKHKSLNFPDWIMMKI